MRTKLLYDLTACQPSQSSKRHGGGRYGEVVFLRILERRLPIASYFDSSRWINPELIERAKERGVAIYDISDNSLDEIVKECGATHIYSAGPLDLRDTCPCHLIFTWHGLRDEETPLDSFFWRYKHNSWKAVVRFALKRFIPKAGFHKKATQNRRVLANPERTFVMVSNHSEKSLRSFYPEAKGREVRVFYSPSTSSDFSLERRCHEKYFMLVSGNRWFKNNLRAIMALDRLFAMGYLQEFKVKITGAKDAGCYRYKLHNPERFDFCGYVDDVELEQLYHDAYCLIYPSLNEGFGYPPLEAMHYGVPVIASPFTSIPEVCGDAVIYFNPFSIEEIMSRILMMVEPNIHSKYSELGRQRYMMITDRQNADLDGLIDYIYSITGANLGC